MVIGLFPFLTSLSSDFKLKYFEEYLLVFIENLVIASIWFAYLSVSKRVKETYGINSIYDSQIDSKNHKKINTSVKKGSSVFYFKIKNVLRGPYNLSEAESLISGLTINSDTPSWKSHTDQPPVPASQQKELEYFFFFYEGSATEFGE